MIRRAGAISLIAGSLAALARPATAQTPGTPVRMGSMAIDAAAEPNYGADAGIFAQYGIAPQITVEQTGNAIMEAVIAGDLDAGVSNPLGLAVAVARNIPIAMIAPCCLYGHSDGNANLAVAKDGPIKTPHDLVGATFGVGALNDFSQLTLMAWLDKNDIPREGVKFVEMKRGEFGTALVKNLIQAALLTEPFKTDAIRAGQIRIIGDTELAVAPETAPIVWFAMKPWLQKNGDLAKRLVRGIYATARYANTHRPETAVSLARMTKLDVAVVSAMARLDFATTNDPRYVEPTLALAYKYGMLPRPVSFAEFCPPLS